MNTATINTNGMNQIWKALESLHKYGGGQNHFTASMLNAWAADAEESFSNGHGMCFEIRGCDSASGEPELVTITAGGYNVTTLNDE